MGLFAGLTSLFLPGLGPIVAAGWIATTIGMTVVGAAAGGVLGALTTAGIPEEQAGYFVEGVRRGGTLVVVRAPTDEVIDIARSVMQRHDPVNIDERVADWRTRGWSGFDPNAEPLNFEALMQERTHRAA